MKYKGFIKKSRTFDAAALTGMAGAALVALPQLQGVLTDAQYGYIFLGLMVWQGYLRTKTTGAIGEKQ